MNSFILDAVALPEKPRNRLWNSVSKRWMEASLRGGEKRAAYSSEQRNNLYLLADQAVAFGIPGDFVEIGCHDGETTRVIASVLEYHHSERQLHLYHGSLDNVFDKGLRERWELNQRKSGLSVWVSHEGNLRDTLPLRLPEAIAFAHVDLGVVDMPELRSYNIQRCLGQIYPRMAPGAICVLMDYHDPERTVNGWDRTPWVKDACDRFFLGKPECMQILYGGNYSHAFFRKVW